MDATNGDRSIAQKAPGFGPKEAGWASKPQGRVGGGHCCRRGVSSGPGLPPRSAPLGSVGVTRAADRGWRLGVLVCVVGALLAASCAAGSSSASSGAATPASSAASAAEATTPPAVTVAPNPAAAGLSGYLAIASDGVVFLQWTQADGALTGSLTMAYTPSGDPTTLKTQNAAFTGVLSGSSVTLSFPEGLGVSTTWTGAFNGSSLVLSFATASGNLNTLTFAPASVADYNQALAQVQAQVQQAQGAASAAAAAQQQQQALQQAQQAIDQDVQQVQADLGYLPPDTTQLRADVHHIPDDLAQQAKDVQQALQDEQATLTAAQQNAAGGDVCGDANTVQGDANTVQGDENTVEGDGNTLSGDVNTIQGATSQLQQAFQDLQGALAALPSYQPAGAPSQQDVSSAMDAANKAVAQAQQTYAGYLAQSRQMVQVAQGYANAAETACSKTGG